MLYFRGLLDALAFYLVFWWDIRLSIKPWDKVISLKEQKPLYCILYEVWDVNQSETASKYRNRTMWCKTGIGYSLSYKYDV